jgi:protein-tyrosine phosphatase
MVIQGVSSDDLVTGVEVEWQSEGCYRFVWPAAVLASPVTLYGGRDAQNIPRERALLHDARPGARVPASWPGVREYFYLQGGDGQGLTVAQRDVPLAGSINFRDLGGYATADGRRVQWGRLFRSGHMANLSAAGLAQFAALDIRAVCDFRTEEERASELRGLPNNPRVEVLGITPGIGDRYFFNRLFDSTDDPQKVVDALHEMMRVLVLTAAPRYQRLFELLLEGPAGAVLINCSAGKERTGLASVLLLTALGVPRATIYYDFMLSQRYFPAEAEIPRVITKYSVRATGEAARNLIMPLLETRESYLQSAFAAIDERYGSGEAMLQAVYGLGASELAHLRDHFTA